MLADHCREDGTLYGRRQRWLIEKCPICERTNQPAHNDHDHATGKMRGIICAQCNIGLGMFHDDPDALNRAAEYLKYFKDKDLDAELKSNHN